MAMIAIRVPDDIAHMISSIEAPGDPENNKHVTIVYLGDDVPIEQLAEAVVVCFNVATATKPFSLRSEKVTTFPKGKDGFPVICPVESPPLHALKARLEEALTKAGVSY